MKRFLILLVITMGGALLPLPLNAQIAAAFDTARMQRDLDIMEGILDRLVFNIPGQFIHIGTEGTKGFYLPDYGVIFLMPWRDEAMSVFSLIPQERRERSATRKKAIEAQREIQQAKRRGDAYSYSVRNAQNMRESLLEFFVKYADAIGQLEDSDRVAVYATGGHNVFVAFGEEPAIEALSAVGSGDSGMLAIARKADIVALRTRRISQEVFEHRVVFREMISEETSTDIDIMANIIDAAWQRRSREPIFRSSGTQGIYLDDYGVIFFTRATFGRTLSFRFFEDLGESDATENLHRRLIELQTASDRRRENWNAEYKKSKQQLGELLANYGHTLRQLKPQDYIVISADLENPSEEGPHYLVCQVKKQHIDAFNARRISRDQLNKLISYMEY